METKWGEWKRISNEEREVYTYVSKRECADKGDKCAQCENQLKCLTGVAV